MSDIKNWKTRVGLLAKVTKHDDLGHLCGYVGVDKNSGFYGVDYSEIERHINVHGGTTFTGHFDDSELWWIGYDCAHSFDYTKYNTSGIKRDLKYCVDECEKLAEQIHQTPIDYLLRSKKIEKLPDQLHNQMLAWAIENPENEIIKEYFENIK